MIRVVRYIGVHLWVASLLAFPFTLYWLPVVQRIFPGLSPVLFFCIILCLIESAGMTASHLYAASRLRAHLKRGQAWERSGLYKKALKSYTRALRLYDSFLVWPFDGGRVAKDISRALAGLWLSSQLEDTGLKSAASVYLKMNPQDREVAKLWLLKIHQAGVISSLDQDVLTVFARLYATDPELSGLLAEIFAGLRRGDVAAIRLYDQVLTANMVSSGLGAEIKDLMDGSVSRKTVGHGRSPLEKEAAIPGRQFEFASIFFWISNRCAKVIRQFVQIFKKVLSCVLRVPEGLKQLTLWRNRHQQMIAYIRAGILVGVSIGLLFFMISTLTHTFKTRVLEKRKLALEAAIPKPFTIQVAAYLKMAHAQRYKSQLEKQNLDAEIRKVEGGGKTWYVVRISAFQDRNSAAEYGQKLKTQKIIEDFFVNNR